jgi:tellurite resistance protein
MDWPAPGWRRNVVDIEGWLKELRLPREAYRMVSLLPLVYVAWADGKIQSQERALILSIARERGLLAHGGEQALERWLADRPSQQQLKADIAALNELARSDRAWAAEFGADEEQLLLAWCQDVADAAGGLLGLRDARRDAEHEALKIIASALDIRSAKQWRAALSY